MSGRRKLLVLLACCWLCSVAQVSDAQTLSSPRIRALLEQARTADAPVAAEAIRNLCGQRHPDAITALAALLDQGLRDDLTIEVTRALGATRSPHAMPTLERLLRHRQTRVRVAALEALGHFVDHTGASSAVAGALSDHEPVVRGAAAQALAAMNARGEVNTLLVAFERGVPEAAEAIGRLADEAQLVAFDRFLTRKPLADMLAGYRACLLRSDVSTTTKLRVVSVLEEVASLSIKRFLQGLLDAGALDQRVDAEVRRAVAASITRIREPQPPGTPRP